MPGYNGSGTYERNYSWAVDAANAVGIDPTRMDVEFNEIVGALSAVMVRDGQAPALADFNMGGFKITNGATPTANSDFAIKSYVDGKFTGAVNTVSQIRRFNGTLATGAEFILTNASAFAGIMFDVNCLSTPVNTFDGVAFFGTGYLGATVPGIATSGVINVSNSHNWASPPTNRLVIGRELSSNRIIFKNTTAVTLTVIINSK